MGGANISPSLFSASLLISRQFNKHLAPSRFAMGCWWVVVAAAAVLSGCDASAQLDVRGSRGTPARPNGRFPDLPLAILDSSNPTCAEHSTLLDAAIRNDTTWASRIWESSAHVPTGWAFGSTFHVGDFEGCFKSGAPFPVQYCLLDIDITPQSLVAREIKDIYTPLKWGMCVPASCSQQDLARSMNNHLPKGMSASIKPTFCSENNEASATPGENFVVWTSICSIIFLVIAGSITDLQQDKNNKAPPGLGKSILLSFSVPRNWKELWRSDDQASPYHLPLHAFDAVRTANCFLVVLGHYAVFKLTYQVYNPERYSEMLQERRWAFVSETSLYVYCMFIIGGVLTAVTHLNTRKSAIFSIVERYFRIVPMILFTLLFSTAVFTQVPYGALQGYLKELLTTCDKHYWADVLLMTNLGLCDDVCMAHFWYVSADFHMFILSVTVLLPLFRYRRSLGLAACLGAVLLSCGISFYQNYSNGWPHYLDITTVKLMRDPKVMIRIMEQMARTQFNVPCYIYGLCLGVWLVDNNRSEHPFKLTKSGARAFQLLGSILCLSTMYVSAAMHGNTSKVDNALYFAFHRVFLCGGATLVFASWMLRPQGPPNVFTRVTARLAFAVYNFHAPLVIAYIIWQRFPFYYGAPEILIQAVGLFVWFLIFALVVSLAIEMPTNNIRLLLLKKRKVE